MINIITFIFYTFILGNFICEATEWSYKAKSEKQLLVLQGIGVIGITILTLLK